MRGVATVAVSKLCDSEAVTVGEEACSWTATVTGTGGGWGTTGARGLRLPSFSGRAGREALVDSWSFGLDRLLSLRFSPCGLSGTNSAGEVSTAGDVGLEDSTER